MNEQIEAAILTDGDFADSDKMTATEGANADADAEAAVRQRIKAAAIAANQRAAADSPGIVSGALGERLYSIDEMRQMTAKEVKGRYHSMLASLRRGFSKW